MKREVAVLGLIITLTIASPASAVQGGGTYAGNDDDTSVVVWIGDATPGSTEGHRADMVAQERPFVYEAVPHQSGGFTLEHLCNAANAPFDPNGGQVPWGWRYTVYKRDRATGALIGEPEDICVPLTDITSPTPPPPPVLPQPPTIGEIWNAAALPAPQIGISPTTQGVTGLETWMWAADPRTSVAVSVTLDGFTVTGTAQLVGYHFDFGEGAAASSTTGGNAEQPAVRHTYETKGQYTIRVATMWRGQFVMTGPGITTPLPVDLRTAQLTNTRAYPVVEIRSVLVG